MKNALTLLLFVVFMITPIFIFTSVAQPPNGTTEPIPIDGGLGFLLAAGLAYGARKLHKKKKEEAEVE